MPLDENAWDPRLYEGSAPYFARGRLPYPPEMAAALRDELALDGTGRLVDLGCGPGSAPCYWHRCLQKWSELILTLE